MRNLPTPEARPLRIFIVENHADTLSSLTLLLEEIGHTILSARSLNEALAALPDAEFDVLLSDIGLPDGDGWELLRRAQLSHPIYAVAMSGFGASADRARSKAAGYRHHLLKPFDPAELEKILDEAAAELSRAA